MKKIFYLFVSAAAGFLPVSAQYINKMHSSSSFFAATKAKEAFNGDQFVVYQPMASTGMNLMRLDANGDILWNKAYEANSMALQFSDFCEVGGDKLIAMRASGNYETVTFDALTGAPLMHDNRIINAGSWSPSGFARLAPDGNDAVFVTTDGNNDSIYFGKILGSNASISFIKVTSLNGLLGNPAFSYQASSISRTSAGQFLVLVDIVNYSTSTYKQAVAKFDGSGNLLLFKYYDLPAGSSYWINGAISEASNGDILVSGYCGVSSATGSYLLRFDSNGNFIWGKHLLNQAGATFHTEHSNGDITVGASSQIFSPDNVARCGLVNLSSSGTFQWARNFGFASSNVIGVSTGSGDFTNVIINSAMVGPGAFVYQTADLTGNMTGCNEVVGPVTMNSFNFLTNPFLVSAVNASLNLSTPFAFTEVTPLTFSSSNPDIVVNGTISDPPCFGQFGNVNISVSAGYPNYTYSWSNGTSNQNLLNVLGGTYYSRVTDAEGCVSVDTFVVTSPTQLAASSSVSNVTCFGSQNGSINVTTSGGTPGYDFQWATQDTTEDISGLSGGFYQLIITDANGCTKTIGVSVAEPQQLISGISASQNVSCSGLCNGSLTGIVSGGVGPYTYSWNVPGGNTTTSVSGLCPGNYLFTATDANNCVTFSNGIITEPNALSVNTNVTQSACGAASGMAIAMGTGGTLPYSYLWSNSMANDTATGLNPGTYTITVTDANNCTTSASALVDIQTDPQAICMVTVDSLNHNVVVWEKAVAGNIAGYNIYRNVVGAYTLIDYVPYDSLSEYTDLTFGVDPNITSYRYEISAVDTCGFESALSSYHQTIHLTSSLGVGGEVNLVWDNYQGFTYSYNRILRDSTNNGNWQVVDSVSATNFTWTDLTPPDSARYLIEVVPGSPCTSTRAIVNTSRSNIKTQQAGPGGVGIEEGEVVNAMVYPNPSHDLINIVVPFNGNRVQLEVYDAQGKLVHAGKITSQNHQLSVGSWSEGIYFFRITYEGTVKAKGKIQVN